MKNESGLALTLLSVSARLEVDWSRNFDYIARNKMLQVAGRSKKYYGVKNMGVKANI